MRMLKTIMFLCVVMAGAGVAVCGEPATGGRVDAVEAGQGGRSRNQLSAQEYQERREWFNAAPGSVDQSPEQEEAQKRLDEKAFTAVYGDGTLKPLTWHDASAENEIVGELIVGPMGLVGKIKDGGIVVGPDGKRIGTVEDFIKPSRAQ